ncbi:MAG TPA: SURF1 family protein [Pseudolysinimonas sp.]|nr:SURF1 family protein [Pseudolysinimonas sp.]
MASGFWAVARRPRWIAALLLCLGIAAGFAALGQWQLERSVDNAQVAEAPDTEAAVPLSSIADPQTAVTPAQLGRTVTVEPGELVAGDFVVVTDRNNGGTEQGAVLVGHLVTADGITLAVALGWAPDAETALAAAGTPSWAGPVTGRYLPSEPPSSSDFEAGRRSAISVAELINIWPDATPAYGGYLNLESTWPGLEPIFSPEPDREVSLNVLNVFYAIEWVIFAGFAIYLWYRLVRDVVEREAEEAAVE